MATATTRAATSSIPTRRPIPIGDGQRHGGRTPLASPGHRGPACRERLSVAPRRSCPGRPVRRACSLLPIPRARAWTLGRGPVYPHGHKRFWWQSLGRGPPRSCDGSSDRGKAGDSFVYEVVDLAALYVGSAVISQRGSGESGVRPRLPDFFRPVLQVGAHVKRGSGVAPDLPGRFRVAQTFAQPAIGKAGARSQICFQSQRGLLRSGSHL